MVFKPLYGWFWEPGKWLSKGLEWSDLQNSGIRQPNSNDIFYHLVIALILLWTRPIVEKWILNPIGHNILQNVYSKSKFKTESDLKRESSKLKVTPLKKSSIDRKIQYHKDLNQFSEHGWRFICYTLSLFMGIWVLWDKAWLWDINQCYEHYPFHELTDDIWWYYALVSGYNMSLLISLFIYPKGRDFTEMFLHHVITITLITMSWSSNYVRIGSIIILLHDVSDVFLEPAKICVLTKPKKIENVCFALFAVSWVFTRVGYFSRILYRSVIELPERYDFVPGGQYQRHFLFMLFFLQLFWTYLIIKTAIRGFTSGEIKDPRDEVKENKIDKEIPSSAQNAQELTYQKKQLQNESGRRKSSLSVRSLVDQIRILDNDFNMSKSN